MIILCIIILAIAIMIQYFIAKQFESVAEQKGHTKSKFFHMCFWLGMVGYLLVIALPDRGINNEAFSQSMPESVEDPREKEVFDWCPVDEATAIAMGETNIKCTKCHRVQFKGNEICIQCGAKFTEIKAQE